MSGEPAASNGCAPCWPMRTGPTGRTRAKRSCWPARSSPASRSTLWLRDGFFKQHCKTVPQPPLHLAHLGRAADGFAALVNYHKLDARLLEKLTYTYLGDWIARQQESQRRGEDGADARLVAAASCRSSSS